MCVVMSLLNYQFYCVCILRLFKFANFYRNGQYFFFTRICTYESGVVPAPRMGSISTYHDKFYFVLASVHTPEFAQPTVIANGTDNSLGLIFASIFQDYGIELECSVYRLCTA